MGCDLSVDFTCSAPFFFFFGSVLFSTLLISYSGGSTRITSKPLCSEFWNWTSCMWDPRPSLNPSVAKFGSARLFFAAAVKGKSKRRLLQPQCRNLSTKRSAQPWRGPIQRQNRARRWRACIRNNWYSLPYILMLVMHLPLPPEDGSKK